jgi:hypothetical protein
MSERESDNIDRAVKFLNDRHPSAKLCVRESNGFRFMGFADEPALYARNNATKQLRQFMDPDSCRENPYANSLCPQFFDAVIRRADCYQMDTSQCLFDGGEKRIYKPDRGIFFGLPSV